MTRAFLLLCLTTVVSACASYSLVSPGKHEFDGLTIQTSQVWNPVYCCTVALSHWALSPDQSPETSRIELKLSVTNT